MKSVNMSSLMAKATKINKAAASRSEEARREAKEAREARRALEESYSKAVSVNTRKEPEEREDKAKPAAPSKEVLDTIAAIRGEAAELKASWKTLVKEDYKVFQSILEHLTEVATSHNLTDVLSILEGVRLLSKETHSFFRRLGALQDRQTQVRENPMAKVIPWDKAAYEAVILEDLAYSLQLKEYAKVLKDLLRDINLTK